MKKTYKILVFLFMLCLTFMLAGCSEEDSEKPITEANDKLIENHETSKIVNNAGKYSSDAFFPAASYDKLPGIKSLYHQFDYLIARMETDPDGNLYVISMDEDSGNVFWAIESSGETKTPLLDSCNYLYFDDKRQCFYSYNSSDGTIEERDRLFNLKRVVLNDFHPFEVSEMVVRDDSIFVFCIMDNPYEGDGIDIYSEPEDGYHDYGEKLYKVSIADGSSTEIAEEGLISMFGPQEGYIYLYVYKDGSYFVNVYDPKSGNTVYSIETNDIGYVFSFAVIGKKIYYFSNGSTGLCSKDLENGVVELEINGYFSLVQSDFDVHGKYLVLLNRSTKEVIVLDTETGEISSGTETVRKTNDKSDVIVGAVSLPFDVGTLSDITGLSIGAYESPMYDEDDFNEKLFMKLMAQDTDIDVFIFMMNDPALKKISRDGVCLPLEVSELLYSENGKYFDNVSDYFRTESGHIWGMPLASSIPVIVSFPDNMAKAGLSKDIFKDFFKMMSALRSIDDRNGVFIQAQQYGYFLLTDFVTNNAGHVNFDSSEFRNYFSETWAGWDKNSNMGYANHPLMGEAKEYAVIDGQKTRISASQNAYMVDPGQTLFHMVDSNAIMIYENLRNGTEIYPMPLISENEVQGIPIGSVAVVNPYGDHREKAIEFMEKYAAYLRENGRIGYIFKDKTDYPDSVHPDSSAFQALHEIYEKAIVMDYGVTADIFYNEISDYQQGKIDLDTAIKSMQRKEDAYRNE